MRGSKTRTLLFLNGAPKDYPSQRLLIALCTSLSISIWTAGMCLQCYFQQRPQHGLIHGEYWVHLSWLYFVLVNRVVILSFPVLSTVAQETSTSETMFRQYRRCLFKVFASELLWYAARTLSTNALAPSPLLPSSNIQFVVCDKSPHVRGRLCESNMQTTSEPAACPSRMQLAPAMISVFTSKAIRGWLSWISHLQGS